MKLGELFKCKDALEKLYAMETDGVTALRIRRELKTIMEEVRNYEDVKDRYIYKHGQPGPDGKFLISPGDEGYEGFRQLIKEMGEPEVDIEIKEPFITEAQISVCMSLSADEIDQLISLGILCLEQGEG